MDEYEKTNLAHWDELVGVHLGLGSDYDVAGFKAGRSTLKPAERRELGDVAGKSLLHLQCHFGLDTLSWARLGASVTGVDFSSAAIDAATALAAEVRQGARFVRSELYALPDVLQGQFDIVYTSYGALTWLSDIPRWARVAAHFVRPGGTLFVAEFHPFGWTFDDAPGTTELNVRYPYFPSDGPQMYEDDGSYADRQARVTNRRTYNYPFTIGGVVSSLIAAGLRIEHLHEFAGCCFRAFPFLEQHEDGLWYVPRAIGDIPLEFSVKATKPGA